MAEEEHIERISMRWDRGEATLQSLGGMLAPVRFDLEDGRSVSPLHVAPWEDEDMRDQPGVLRQLRGDWPCIPFGAPPARRLPFPWHAKVARIGNHRLPSEGHPHGYGANHHWDLQASTGNRLSGTIRYPDDHPIEALERHVDGVAGRTELTCSLTVTPRRDCHLPIGLHPVFRLPEGEGDALVDVGPHGTVWSHPLDEDVPLSMVEPNRHFETLDRLWSRQERPLSLARLPLGGQSETLLLLTGVCGRVVLTNKAERYRATLQWDPKVFPSLMLWISNRGRAYRPWNGRHLAIGIEPVRAAFDLGVRISTCPNPLNQAGVETSYPFQAGTPFTTKYTIGVEAV
ncbi:hypothetical protein [Rhizobium sp. AG855]|uniref:hypothetical protein n=1 Tax=Rhizobium sp. AG855 TaxID=2183898 RepID=UPI000E7364F8|nr:hypothetical protein [Rhizobium sp. AG855]RKE77520.1 hypothetical protein DFO46_4488 [Rhizobium sp. AG855]